MQSTAIFAIVMAAAASAAPLEGRQLGDARGTISLYSGSGCEDASVVRFNVEISPGCLTLDESYSSIQLNGYESNIGLPWYSKPGPVPTQCRCIAFQFLVGEYRSSLS